MARWSNTRTKDEIPYRDRLRKEFGALLEPLSHTNAERSDPATYALARATMTLLDGGEQLQPEQERAARIELMRWAYEAANELRLSLPHLELRPRSQPLTRRTLALTQACIQRRYELLAIPATFDRGALERLDRQVTRAGRRFARSTKWAPPHLRRWQWHEHYNAACLYAISLDRDHALMPQAPEIEETVHRDLVRRAINRLERAITLRESAYVDTWRDWVLSEDPDLRALRTEPAFAAFEAMYFPSRTLLRRPAQRLRKEPHRLVESRYTRDLLDTLARRWHDRWHARASKRLPWDTHAPFDWCGEELELWRLVGEVAADGYDWRIRQGLLERANELLALEPPIVVRFCRYEDSPPKHDASRNGGDPAASGGVDVDVDADHERKLADSV